MKETAPETTPHIAAKIVDPKMSKIKVAFLYVLIGGLVVSALISVVAILIGQFNEVVVKALLTTLIFVTHSLLILALVLADKRNSIGKSIVSTSIFAVIVLNMLTTTFGTWEIWDREISWRAFLFYMLVIGSAFIVTGALKLRVAHRNTNIAVYATAGLVALLTAVLIPWVMMPDALWLGSFYYRLIAAITILAATTLSLSVIFNRIAVSQKPELKKVVEVHNDTPGGLLAIYIVVGTFAGFFWLFGLTALISSAARVDRPAHPTIYQDERDNKYDYNNR